MTRDARCRNPDAARQVRWQPRNKVLSYAVLRLRSVAVMTLVAVPFAQLKRDGDHVALAGATQDALNAIPNFIY